MSQRRGGQYQYQKITTTTTRTVTNNPINKTFPQAGQKGKIDVTVLKNKNVQFFKAEKEESILRNQEKRSRKW